MARGLTPYRANAAVLQVVDLQQAADDILERISDPQTADLVAKVAMQTNERARQRAVLSLLARRLGSDWNSGATIRKS